MLYDTLSLTLLYSRCPGPCLCEASALPLNYTQSGVNLLETEWQLGLMEHIYLHSTGEVSKDLLSQDFRSYPKGRVCSSGGEILLDM